VDFRIIDCPSWGAVLPRNGLDSIIWTPDPADRCIIHHTAGHHAEISRPQDESHLEALLYVRSLQKFHMRPEPLGRGWNDTGQNFTVCRNGEIYQGRWRTIRAIQHRRMVVSAHTLGDKGRPSQNDQIGIEFEHVAPEPMTMIQREAGSWLQAWVAHQYGKRNPLPADPHHKYTSTNCPTNLENDIEIMWEKANWILDRGSV